MPPRLSDEAEALLSSEPLVAHLATCRDGWPHVAPLWYVVQEGAIELATTGRKLANLRKNPAVALSVEHSQDGEPLWGVSVQGTATVVAADEGGREITRRVNRRYGADEGDWAQNTAVRIAVEWSSTWRY